MAPMNMEQFLKLPKKTRLLVWACLSLAAIVLLLSGADWPQIAAVLNPVYIFNFHLAPWGVLGLCILVCYVKRGAIRAGMETAPTVPYLIAGLALFSAAFFIPLSDPFFLLRLLTAVVGLFAAAFGQGALIPIALLLSYAFAVTVPVLINTCLGPSYAMTAVTPVAWLFHLFNLHIQVSGQVFRFLQPSGQPLAVLVAGACAGPATMSVFVVIFTLMMIDRTLPRSVALPIFLFGIAGTWLQNVVRIVIILCAGYFLGKRALDIAHYYTVYILFPLWYLLFAGIYFQCDRNNMG